MPFQEDGPSSEPVKTPSRKDLEQEIIQLKRALAQEQQRREWILKATNLAVYEWDLLSGNFSWNEGFLSLMGYEREEIENTPDFLSSHLHPQDRERVQGCLQAVFQQGNNHFEEHYQFRRKDGSYAFVLERGYVVYDAQSKPVRMVGTLQDVSRQKQSELALEALSKEYAFLLDEIPILVFSNSADGGADFVNRQWLAYTGLTKEEIVGDGWTKALHPLDVEPTLQIRQQAVRNAAPYLLQQRLRRQDGSYRWFQVDTLPYKDKEGHILKWFGTYTDIEEVKQAQEALQQSMELLQQAKAEAEGQLAYFYSLLMAIPSPIAIVRGKDHKLEFFNPQLEKVVANRIQVGVPFAQCLEGFSMAYFLELIGQVYHSGEPREIIEMPIHLSIQQHTPAAYYNLLFQAIHNQTEEVTGVMIFYKDVSEQVIARKKVEESRARIRSILDGIPAMAWTTDAEGHTTYFNSHWYSYCGIPQGELINTYEFIHPEDVQTVGLSWQEAQSSKQSWHAQYRLRRADGTYRWHLGRTVPVLDSEGTLQEWFGVGIDIEEQKQTQKRLETTLAELHEKNFELDQFVYKTSHDLRAPLTTILGLVTIIRGESEEKTKKQYVDLIEGRVQKLDIFIKSMLDYSRNTRTPVKAASIPFSALIEECVQELASLKHFDRLQISTHIAGENFYSDPFRVKIIFSNLISNAIKYQDFAKEDSFLKIGIEIFPSQARIDFEDNGVGVKQAHQGNLFDMFFRASEQSEGSGLGLYIVKQAVTVLQGSISVESQPNVGTLFKIWLPNAATS